MFVRLQITLLVFALDLIQRVTDDTISSTFVIKRNMSVLLKIQFLTYDHKRHQVARKQSISNKGCITNAKYKSTEITYVK